MYTSLWTTNLCTDVFFRIFAPTLSKQIVSMDRVFVYGTSVEGENFTDRVKETKTMENFNIIQFLKSHKKSVGIVAAGLLSIFAYHVMFGYNTATQLLVKQSPNGSLSCVDHAGFYFKGPFTTIYSYDRTKDFLGHIK